MQDALTAPHILVCLPVAQHSLGARIAQRLTPRGLRVSLVSDTAQLQQQTAFAAICIGIASRRHGASLVTAAIAAATAAQRPLFPLLLHHERDVPPSLKDTQWSDFSQSFDSGWRELLLALDMEHLLSLIHI